MKHFNLPKKITTLIFDIDSTLYTNEEYAFEQIDCQIREYAKLIHITDEQARKKISDYRKEYIDLHNGKTTSLGNTFIKLGIPLTQSIEWRKTLIEPNQFLHRDEKLISSLTELSKRFKLCCVTNNPVLTARKTLQALGVDSFFENIIGLDSYQVSKPNILPFEKALEQANSISQESVSIGDRFDIDLAIPLQMGMGGILVDGVEDVYKIQNSI